MHHQSIYNDPRRLDFALLAQAVPALAPHVHVDADGRAEIDFEDPEANRQLTSAFLKRDFGLDLTLPPDRLCPGVPGRLDYALWIAEIASYGQVAPIQRALDIGTGASAIYALLLAKMHPQLLLTGTEADPKSLAAARHNCQVNGLGDHIHILQAGVEDPLSAPGTEPFDLSLCNPPFYASSEEIQELAAAKSLPAFAACTGAPCEMVTAGGESAFVRRMIADGLAERVRWASSLLGKLSSVSEVVAELKKRDIDNYALVELQQGKTRRWAVAWSLAPGRLPDSLSRPFAPALAKLLPAPNTLSSRLMLDLQAAEEALDRVLDDAAVSRSPWHEGICEVEALIASWTRQERRKRARGETTMSDSPEPALRCRLRLLERKGELQLDCSWQFGRSRQIFVGFVAHLRTALQQ